MNILAIIPARGGSKGVLRKNIKLFCGIPLIYYAIGGALNSQKIDKVVVSTDDDEIAILSKKYGAEIIARPKYLAKDDSSVIDSVLHVLKYLELSNYYPNIVVLLQPTSPLRTSNDIESALEIFITNKDHCDSVISITEFPHSPYLCLKIENDFLTPHFDKNFLAVPRQDLPKLYQPNGAIFISTPKHLKTHKTFYGSHSLPYIMPEERSIDIDTELDFKLGETILEAKNEEKNRYTE